jgi:hypothetical protein
MYFFLFQTSSVILDILSITPVFYFAIPPIVSPIVIIFFSFLGRAHTPEEPGRSQSKIFFCIKIKKKLFCTVHIHDLWYDIQDL